MKVTIVGAGNLGGAVAAGLVASGRSGRDLRCVTRTPEGAARLRARPGLADAGRHDRRGRSGVRRGRRHARREAVRRARRAARTRTAPRSGHDAREPRCGGRPRRPGRRRTDGRTRRAADDEHAGAGACCRVARRRRAGCRCAAVARVVALSDALGTTHVLDESLFDAATALAGSGPAYVFLLVELLRDAASASGSMRTTALAMTRGMVDGAARLLSGSGEDPESHCAVRSPRPAG
jgi:pyrroline-5-carboxylate reductase